MKKVFGKVDPQIEILIDFFKATNGENWKIKANWTTAFPIKTWHGVKVNSDNKVISINLEHNDLKGSLPESLSNLTDLKELNLSKNYLSEDLNDNFFSKFSSLEVLDLSNNDLTGHLPSSLYDVTTLKYVNLTRNHFRGKINDAICNLTYLEELNLSHNCLVGLIPSTINNLFYLRNLDLSCNRFRGEIAKDFFSVMPNLERLALFGNRVEINFHDLPPQIEDDSEGKI
jgi:Leucine-rich repeat (LRR) protein